MDILERFEKKQWKVDIKCKECETSLRIYKSDIGLDNRRSVFPVDEWNFSLYAICPVCETVETMNKYVPYEIAMDLIENYRKRIRNMD